MNSMTGYACREWAGEDISFSVEIKGCNSRYLDVQVYAPSWLSHLEPKIRELIGSFCGRGKVDVSIRVRESNTPLNVSVNANAAASYLNAITALASDLGIEGKVSISELIGMEGVIDVEKQHDDEKYWVLMEPVLMDAAKVFQAERAREGSHTEENIFSSIGIIESSLEIVKSHVQELENSIKENIKTRFREIAGNEIDGNRVLAETAVLLMKYTISEEISRLGSHLGEFRLASGNERPGKKLDFLCQEINREINTIGSKSTILEVSKAVVDMKEALENAREQLRNIE